MFSCFYSCFHRNKKREDATIDQKNEDVVQKEEEDDYDHMIYKWEDTVHFTVPVTCGQVIKVYDGDTITIAARLPMVNSPLHRFSVRLNGIDAPEIKGKDEDEKIAAQEAKQFLSNLILHKKVKLLNRDTEKYGRILADVYIGDTLVNALLFKERYVVEYGGGTKNPPKSWREYRLTGKRD